MNKKKLVLSLCVLFGVIQFAGCKKEKPVESRPTIRDVRGGFKTSAAALGDCVKLEIDLDTNIRLYERPTSEGESIFNDVEKKQALKAVLASAERLSEVANSYVVTKYEDDSAADNVQKIRELARYADEKLIHYRALQQR